MLIPIGHEGDDCRRVPWVTFGIMALCALGFLWSLQEDGKASKRVERRTEEALEYYAERPYLELDDAFEERLLGRRPDSILATIEEEVPPPRRRPVDAIVVLQQEKLDRLCAAAIGELERHWAFRWGFSPATRRVDALVTHMFLHGDWAHLLGNMFFLYLVGPFVEDRMGRWLYGGFYLLAGFAAASLFAGRSPESLTPMIGASGAVAGVMGAFMIRFWSIKIRMFYWFAFIFYGTFFAPAWLVMLLWVAGELVLALIVDALGITAGVAYWAHVGGFVFGSVATLGLLWSGIDDRVIQPRLEARVNPLLVDNRSVDQAMSVYASGRSGAALRMLAEEAADTDVSQDALIAGWEVAQASGQADEGAAMLLRAIEQELASGENELALAHWEELVDSRARFTAKAPLLCRLGEQLARMHRPDLAAEAFSRAMECTGQPLAASRLLRMARLCRKSDPALALRAVKTALLELDLHLDEKLELERMARELGALGGSA